MKYLFLLSLLPLLSATAARLELTESDIDPSAEEILIKQPEKHLRHESMIYNLNTELGIRDQRKFTGQDRNRFSLAGHISGDYEHFDEIFGLEAVYMRRTTSYNQLWWGFQVFQHRTYFDAITQNHRSGTNPNSEAQFQRASGVKNTVLGLGPGIGYRFKLLLDFFPTEDVFESIDVFANVIDLNETHMGERYRGYGLTTNYGIHKRSSTSFFYGGKLSYNVASVTREALGNEKRRERSLSLGWLSLAFELGFFY
jgi:hypothetical protein